MNKPLRNWYSATTWFGKGKGRQIMAGVALFSH
jgi:hypothetical protein